MSRLSWISDQAFTQAVTKLFESAHSSKEESQTRQQKNVVDPFLSLIIANTYNLSSVTELQTYLNTVASLRSMSNHLGAFHQQVLANAQGWINHDALYDLENKKQKLIAEIKNKHNTMNKSNRQKVVEDLCTTLQQKGKGWQAYLVIIIPKDPQKYTKPIPNTLKKELYEIDGSSFYHKVTGDRDALQNVYQELVSTIKGINSKFSDELESFCTEIAAGTLAR